MARTRPKVSVLMAARNVRRLIEPAVRSVLAQRGVSFELLIADDSSRDGTAQSLRAFRGDPRIRFWQWRRRRGAAAARNYLLRRARGSYIHILDADDLLTPNALRTMVLALDRHPEAGVVYGSAYVIGHYDRGRLRRVWGPRGPRRVWDILEMPVAQSSSMIRRGCIQRISGFREDLSCGQDFDLFLRLAEITRFYRIRRSSPLHIYHEDRPGALTLQTRRRIQQRRAVMRRILANAIWRRYYRKLSWKP